MKNIEFLKESLIAHRGLQDSNTIENTIRAFIKAMDKDYIIELDVHMLSDKTIVVYHDFDLKRLVGVNRIIEILNYKELSKYKIKKKYIIPTLSQVLSIINGKVPLLIEVKDLGHNIEFYKELATMLDNYKGKFAIHSTNPKVMDWYNKYRQNYVIGLIIFNELNYKIFKKYVDKIDFLSVYKKQLPFKVKKMILGWTIKTKKELNLFKNKADNLICENILDCF